MKSRLGRSLTFRGKDEIAKRSGGKPREKQDGRPKNEREGARIESKKKKARRKARTYNALFLVAARFKGKRTLLDISIRDEHATFGRERRKDTGAWWKEREKVRW